MEPIKDPQKIKKMFVQGQTNIIDTQSGYKYTMTALCPKDSYYSPVILIERSDQSLSRVVFQCPICSNQFEVIQDEIYIR
jgi:hypothetical protein